MCVLTSQWCNPRDGLTVGSQNLVANVQVNFFSYEVDSNTTTVMKS